MRGAAVLALLTALLLAAPAHAADRGCGQLDPDPPAASPRIVSGELEGHPYHVLLPADYATSTRRYPALYLLPGRQYSENSWLVKTDLAEFTKGFTGARAAIVVTPSMGYNDWALDYYDGTQDWERFAFERLIPHIDSRFRTLADGAHRAVAGFSAGGAGALRWAAHRPELFAAAGGFSAPVPFPGPDQPYAGPGEVQPSSGAGSPGPRRGPSNDPYGPPQEGCSADSDTHAIGNPATNRWFMHGNDAASLAVNLRGLGVYTSSGNSQPCGPQDARDPTFLGPVEAGLRMLNRQFDAALTAAEVPHVNDELPCGTHNMVTAEAGMHRFWDVMTKSFGRPELERFDYRSLFADAAAWGWQFRADPRRAPEFVEVRGASAGGLTLIGSGTETVVTPPLFEPGESVRVEGAAPADATADAGGRLTIAADLGAPASTPQFDGDERHWTARRIRFSGSAPEPPVRTAAAVFPGEHPCGAGATLTIRLRHPGHRERRTSVAVSVNGRRVLVRRTRGSAARKTVVLRDLPAGELRVTVRVRTTKRRVLRATRAYPPCG